MFRAAQQIFATFSRIVRGKMGEEKKKSEIAESVSKNRLRPEHGSRSKDLLTTEINHHTATDFAFLHLGKDGVDVR
ncbi:hypothetical protein BSR05_25055 [Escherichia coli]|nr:hypothetical protein BSR05_25055 [Escherichia coli]